MSAFTKDYDHWEGANNVNSKVELLWITKRNKKRGTLAQMAERVTADSRVNVSILSKDQM